MIRTTSTAVFACMSKACAPPPVGTGGSSGGMATQKQIDYMVSLANKVSKTSFRYPSQIPWLKQRLTMRERSGQISKTRASALIDELLSITG